MPLSTELLQFVVDRAVAVPLSTELLQFVVDRAVAVPLSTELLQFVVDRAVAVPLSTELLHIGVVKATVEHVIKHALFSRVINIKFQKSKTINAAVLRWKVFYIFECNTILQMKLQ